ncbi:hypothetical protein SUGI_1028380 [Cryptomeria japonica]|uniref:transcription initiation factor TFIID subunit 8 n=1 Tax=Cryptomeria japonica TaxID=3369 RepID=UPI002414A21E|nr:transcription initiation factor TFIID subunit 8 [Cryptomeria japonica]GLJ48763.1 hypothetical protein SUGI_1028380 [Cryptomeria japonica]
MSNGGSAAAETEKAKNEKKPLETGADAFGRAIARIAVGQICESAGFQSCQESALEALADIAVRYLGDLGKSAHFYANLACRTECNVFDVIQSLEDMNHPQGFVGASNILSRRLSASATVKDIIHYTNRSEEIPFARPVPHFPVAKKRELMPSFAQMGEAPPSSQIPQWLPAFPDPHTYVHTPVWNERKSDPRMDKIEQARQRRKAERSLLNLQQRLACAGGPSSSQPFAAPVEMDDIARAKGKSLQHPGPNLNPNSNPTVNPTNNSITNPFLAPPVSAEERAVSPVRVPEQISFKAGDRNWGGGTEKGLKMPSVLEAFAPAIEAAKQGLDCANELAGGASRGVQVLPDERPLVHFKFDFGKKAAFASHVASAGVRNSGVPLPGHWFGRDEEKDEKKRRAEQILKAAMENPQDLAQV